MCSCHTGLAKIVLLSVVFCFFFCFCASWDDQCRLVDDLLSAGLQSCSRTAFQLLAHFILALPYVYSPISLSLSSLSALSLSFCHHLFTCLPFALLLPSCVLILAGACLPSVLFIVELFRFTSELKFRFMFHSFFYLYIVRLFSYCMCTECGSKVCIASSLMQLSSEICCSLLGRLTILSAMS